MSVPFPVLPRGSVVAPRLVRVGGDLVSTLGGPTQRITRMGSRFAVEVQLPTLDAECAAAWLAVPLRAEVTGETVVLTMPQSLDVSSLVGVTGEGAANQARVTYTGPAPRTGMWFSYRAGGRNYLHTITAEEPGAIYVSPLLRVAMPAGTSLEFIAPKLEGFPDATSWSLEYLRFVGHQFTLTENA